MASLTCWARFSSLRKTEDCEGKIISVQYLRGSIDVSLELYPGEGFRRAKKIKFDQLQNKFDL